MTASPELKRYHPSEFGDGMIPSPKGEWVSLSDVEAYAQAAIAAAMMGAVNPIIAEHLTYDGIAKGGHVNEDLAKLAGAIAAVLDHVTKAQYSATPTDAMAALSERERQAEQRGFERAKEQAAQIVNPAPDTKYSLWAENLRHIAAEIRAMRGGA